MRLFGRAGKTDADRAEWALRKGVADALAESSKYLPETARISAHRIGRSGMAISAAFAPRPVIGTTVAIGHIGHFGARSLGVIAGGASVASGIALLAAAV